MKEKKERGLWKDALSNTREVCSAMFANFQPLDRPGCGKPPQGRTGRRHRQPCFQLGSGTSGVRGNPTALFYGQRQPV